MPSKLRLMRAVYGGYVEKVRSLLDEGAYINDQDCFAFGFAPLHMAVKFQHLPVVAFLLQRGAYVDITCSCMKTPLHYAVQYGYESIALCLLFYNANVNARDFEGSTPASLAFSLKSELALNIIVARMTNVNQLCRRGMTLIEKAVPRGHIYLTRLLVNRGVKVNYITSLKMSLLYMSCCYTANDAEMIECILKGGANPNELEPDGSTAFHYVLQHAERNIIELMINYGASLEIRTSDGRTPLHSAAMNKHRNVLKMLLDKGADVNARTVHGITVLETSLHSRSLKNHEIITYLIWKGAECGNKTITSMMSMPLNYWTEKERIVLKRIALDDYENRLSDESKREIAANISTSQFYETCKAELAQLSKIEVNEGYSAVDILSISEQRQFVKLVVGCQIKEIFNSDMFPMYHRTYMAIFSKDVEDEIAKENAALFLGELFNLYSDDLPITKIVSNLTPDNLKHFSPKRFVPISKCENT